MPGISISSFTTQLTANHDFWRILFSSSESEIMMTSGELAVMEYRETDEVAHDDCGRFQSELRSAVSDMQEGGLFKLIGIQFRGALRHSM